MSRRSQYLEAIGIDVWQARARRTTRPVGMRGAAEAPPARAPRATLPPPIETAALKRSQAAADEATWAALQREVQECRHCALAQSRTQTVFGVGNRCAELLVVGEAPGAEEDRQGEPFVGRAGQLLNSMLQSIDHPRASVYIANVLKCRPPGNRDPRPEEVQCCLPYLERQVELLRPLLILALGRIAAQNLLATNAPIGRLRGQLHRFGARATPLIVTYHPAYLLRSPGEKRKAWADLKFARSELARLSRPAAAAM